jgi:hypothetical protein
MSLELGDTFMRTVQLAIHDPSFAGRIRALLSQDEACNVVVTEQADLKSDGIILMDEDAFGALSQPVADADRFVVIAGRNSLGLERMWEAGIHHVVFQGDSPTTVELAIIAALLRTATKRESFAPFDSHWPDLGIAHSIASNCPEVRRSRPC